jgi:segregation and condensation protein B
VNPEIVKTLMERNWVRVVGHRDVPGHPELLGTTSEFLDYFSLKSIEDLPPLAELKSLTDLNLQLPLPVTPEAAAAAAAGDSGNEGVVDHGEVALVPAMEDSAEKLDAAPDDDADDEELTAPGSSAAGLVAAPPSQED